MPLIPSHPTLRAVPRMAAQARNNRATIIPAPTKGLDTSRPLMAQDPLTALLLQNWWVRKWGAELRGGYKRWTTNLGGIGTEAPINTLMAYRTPPGAAGTANPALFAAANNGDIYDVTAQTAEGVVPAASQIVAGQNNPGVFSYVNFATGGTSYLCCVSAGGGYWTYDSAGGWVNRTASITGIGADTFDFIMVWKSRLWFIRKDTTEAYYLPTNVIQGAATKFDFGPLLSHGGFLSVMVSWTMDAGDGIDDRLVMIGSEGDVLIYQGTDPSTADTFGMIGRWFVGRVPTGRRYATKHGGDVSIVTERGIEYLSRVMSGRGLLDPDAVRDDPTYRYSEVIGRDVSNTRNQEGWSILYYPGEESVIITTPRVTVANSTQYVLGALTRGWSTFKGLPINCLEVFEGELYFGTIDGKVCQAFTANSDDQLTTGTPGPDIRGEIQTAFTTDAEQPIALKRPLLIMPMFQAPAAPSIQAQINSEWSSNGVAGSPSFVNSEAGEWNSGLWNTAVWGTAEQAFFAWLGASGLGCYFSLRMSVVGLPGTIFTSWKLVYELGGLM